MREFLELLGLVDPPAGRREPVALPAWTRWALPAVAGVLAIASFVVFAVVRALVG
jgi:hypothetical protein